MLVTSIVLLNLLIGAASLIYTEALGQWEDINTMLRARIILRLEGSKKSLTVCICLKAKYAFPSLFPMNWNASARRLTLLLTC